MRRLLAVLLVMGIWSAVSILALLWGFTYNWPDYVHVDYGLPQTWATHTLSTFIGPADTWRVDIGGLLLDLVFWLGTMIAAVGVLLYRFRR